MFNINRIYRGEKHKQVTSVIDQIENSMIATLEAVAPNTYYYSNILEIELVEESKPKINIKELRSHEEFLHEETILIDRSRSSSASKDSFEFSKEWSKQFLLEYERANTEGQGKDILSSLQSSIGVDAGIKSEIKSGISSTLRNQVEETIKNKYSIVEGVKYRRVEKTEIDIPAYTKTKLILRWKKIWQQGMIEIVKPGSKVEIPFSVLVSLTFDRRQIDL